jgi:tetratricopeptide (TPR) repeat protein
MNNLAEVLRAQGDLAGARSLHEEVLSSRRRMLGTEHPATLTSMNNLAEVLRAQGDLAGARSLHEEALSVLRRVWGAEHPDTLQSMNMLAEVLKDHDDLSAAYALLEEACSVSRHVLGTEHPDTLRYMESLAAVLWAQQDYAGAQALLEELIVLLWKSQGSESPQILKIRSIIDQLVELQKQDSTEEDHPKSPKTQRNPLDYSPTSSRTSVVDYGEIRSTFKQGHQALALKREGNLEAAKNLQEDILAQRRQLLGDNDALTLTAMNNLAETLAALHELDAALKLHSEAFRRRGRTLGPTHPSTIISGHNLAATYWEQGSSSRALTQWNSVLDDLQNDHPHADIIRELHHQANSQATPFEPSE